MKIAIALLGFLIVVVVFEAWVRAYRTIKGDDGPLLAKGSARPSKRTIPSRTSSRRISEAKPS